MKTIAGQQRHLAPNMLQKSFLHLSLDSFSQVLLSTILHIELHLLSGSQCSHFLRFLRTVSLFRTCPAFMPQFLLFIFLCTTFVHDFFHALSLYFVCFCLCSATVCALSPAWFRMCFCFCTSYHTSIVCVSSLVICTFCSLFLHFGNRHCVFSSNVSLTVCFCTSATLLSRF